MEGVLIIIMKYHINKINRTVNLDDNLVNWYTKMSELHDSVFTLPILYKYGQYPTQEITDEELSLICNKALASELEAALLIPKALEYINNHPEFKETDKPIEAVLK